LELNSIHEIALFEHQFWLQILGDHSRFILNALSPKESYFIQQANQFMKQFDKLLSKSYQTYSDEAIAELNSEAYAAGVKFREFKLAILYQQIVEKIEIHLQPTFINHMVNELEEYLMILYSLLQGNLPESSDLQLHLLWLIDGAGHASTIACSLDETEKELIEKNRDFSKTFTNLYLRSIELNGFTRTGVSEFPALKKHNVEVEVLMNNFKEQLFELKRTIKEKLVLGTLTPLMMDHMYREECYYMTKLSMVSEVRNPECDPTKAREE
jgi:hypothetical protein